jgi:hypothetical protein
MSPRTHGFAGNKRLSIGHRWDEAMKESHALQYMLDRLEQEQREEKAGISESGLSEQD